jgi:hypothetical protein
LWTLPCPRAAAPRACSAAPAAGRSRRAALPRRRAGLRREERWALALVLKYPPELQSLGSTLTTGASIALKLPLSKADAAEGPLTAPLAAKCARRPFSSRLERDLAGEALLSADANARLMRRARAWWRRAWRNSGGAFRERDARRAPPEAGHATKPPSSSGSCTATQRAPRRRMARATRASSKARSLGTDHGPISTNSGTT